MASGLTVHAQVHTKSNKPVTCPHHKGNKAVLICLRPECNAAFACVECVATTHRGHEIEKLETYAAEKKAALKDKMKAVKETLLDELRQKLETTKNKIASNKTQIKDEQQKIIKRCNALKEELDKIAKKCSKSCERTGEENNKKLKEHMGFLELIYTKYKSELDKCEKVIEAGSDSDIVHVEKELLDTPEIPRFPDMDIFKFMSGYLSTGILVDLFGEVMSMNDTTQLSSIMTETVTSNEEGVDTLSVVSTHTKNLGVMLQFHLQSDNDNNCGLIQQLSDQIYVWFQDSYNVFCLRKDGKIINRITLQSSPGIFKKDHIVDTCFSPLDGTLWSVNSNGRIQQVKQDGKKIQSVKYFVDREEKPQSLCVTRSQEVVVGLNDKSLVIILATTGKFTRTLKSNDIGLDSHSTNIIQCEKTGRLALTDLIRVSVMDEKYNHLYTIHGDTVTSADGSSIATGYTSKKMFDPKKMCFDSDGNLLVVDNKNHSVVMFSPGGQYIRTIVKETDYNKRPTTINVAPDRTLWVAYSSYAIRQIKYK